MSKFFLHDEYNSITESYETIEDAISCAKDIIADSNIEGWPQEILDGAIKIGVITHISTPKNIRDTEHPEWDFECEVEMEPTKHFDEISLLQKKLSIMEKRVENLLRSNEYYEGKTAKIETLPHPRISSSVHGVKTIYIEQDETWLIGQWADQAKIKDQELIKEYEALI